MLSGAPRPARAALVLGILAVCACLFALAATAAFAGSPRHASRAAHRPIVRHGCAVKPRNATCTRSSRQARRAAARVQAPRVPARPPLAPPSAGTPSPTSPAPPAPGGQGTSGQGQSASIEPFAELPESSIVGEVASEPSEGAEEAPSGEAGEEAQEGEEGASETPTQEEDEAEWPEIPGPGHQRKYAGPLPADEGETLADPIDPRFLTYVPFGTRSFWVQPWRAYLDTWPASRLLNAVGINFGGGGAAGAAIAQLLADSGFKLARRGLPWDAMSYTSPGTFRNPSKLLAELQNLRKHGLRPLLVLDADSQAPTPEAHVKLETVASAPAGAQTVTLSAASAAQVSVGKTAFDGLTFKGPDVLIAALSPSHIATLSRPLAHELPAGAHSASTLLYAPFQAPTLPGGAPNPAFRETLSGWLGYVAAVCKLAASAAGPGGFDLEIWNELTFGSQFLNREYYEAPPATEAARLHRRAVNKAIHRAILDETVAFVRNAANGISPAVGITNGFASQTPFPSGAAAPPGLTALSKHPYNGPKEFPAAYPEVHNLPIDALGERDSPKGSFTPAFIPTYQSLLPEYTISGDFTESLLRDVAPFTTYVYGFPHGRYVAPAGQQPVQKWITEYNLGMAKATPVGPDEVTPEPGVTLSAADRSHFHAKALLRDLVAMVSKGENRDYFFHADEGADPANLVGQGFLEAAAAHPGAYPGDAAGGEVLTGFRNMLAQFQGPGPGSQGAHQLKLLSITQHGNHAQFQGDGTLAHPPLYDRDVLAVFPFQSSPTRFVIPVYVMTSDLLTLYRPEAPASDVTRFDLPEETFTITLGNLPSSATAPTISAYDPLAGHGTPARIVSREGSTATIEIAATDYPRLLSIEY